MLVSIYGGILRVILLKYLCVHLRVCKGVKYVDRDRIRKE